MIKMTARILGALVLGSLLSPAYGEFKPAVHFGYDFGGDTLLKGSYSDGSSSSIRAGDGVVFAGGGSYYLTPAVALHATAGIKWGMIRKASNADASFLRYPLEGLLSYSFGNARLGAGLTYHLNPKLSASGAYSEAALDFDNATGTVISFDYRIADEVAVGVRRTVLNYVVSGTDYEVNADSWSMIMTARF